MTPEPTSTEPAISPQPVPTPQTIPSPRPVPKPRAASDAETIRAPADQPAAAQPVADQQTADALTGTASGAAGGGGRNWPVVIGSVAVLGLGIGWFLLSLFVFHDPFTDSLTEGIGAALGLLVAISIIGAIVSARGHRDRPADS